jgi:phosphatidylglycerol:prolipoprotein diacylglycerol transferase
MLTYPHIDPVAIDLGPIKIHWYGIMYLVAFGTAWMLGKYRAKQPNSGWTEEEVNDLIFYGALGVVLGGRIGYVLFYNFTAFLNDPLMLFRVWEGGMSFHGGLLGVVLALYFFGRRFKKTFFQVSDFVAPLVPLGYFAGRMGNFINGELWGRPADVPWAMVFPHVDNIPRHPSMLYQGFLEGLGTFVILWIFSSKSRPRMAVSGMFLVLFGVFRVFNEFFRQPDAHIGFIAFNWLTMGQLLSVPMLFVGGFFIWWAYKKNPVSA